MAPAHDPFAPSKSRGPRRSGLLPDVFEAGARGAGATDDDLARIRAFWWRGTVEQRASAEEMIADFTPEEWAQFLDGWRHAMDDPAFDPWDDDYEPASDATEAQEATGDTETGDDTPDLDGVQVTLLGPDGTVLDPDVLGELVDLGPVPEGMVEAGWMRPDGEVDGVPMGVGMRGFVPLDSKAAIDFIGDGDEGDNERVGRARLVLAAELQRPAAGRRKKVIAATVAVLGDDEVNDQVLAAGEGLGG